MKKLLAFIVLVIAFVFATSSADARSRLSHRYSHHLTWRHFHHHHYTHLRHHRRHYARRGSMPGPCYTAAAMGGPCGCWAEFVLLGRLDHVWHGINWWLANDWLRLPRTAPAAGTAAVWPGRHVAPVIAVHNDKTGRAIAITTRESWGMRRVSLSGLVIVQPPGLYRRGPLVRYSSGSLG